MQDRAKKSVGKAARRGARTATPPPRPKPGRAGTSRAAAAARFVKDLLVRGEAAKLTKAGKLPLRATHVIVKEKAGGAVVVRRARFRAF